MVVTSRQHCIRGPTLEWIERHFPGVFAEVHFGNHWALEGQSKAKSEICRRVPFLTQGASPANWQACALVGQVRPLRSPRVRLIYMCDTVYNIKRARAGTSGLRC